MNDCEFTKEQRQISQHNRNLARLHFFGSKYGKKGWVLHHKDMTLRENNKERYIQWRIEDLVPMTVSDHCALHHVGKQYFLGRKHSPETIEKMRQVKSMVSQETREKMRKAQLGKHHTEEAKAKMSESQKGNKNHLGKKCTEEQKERMRQSHLGKSLSEECKKKLCEVRKGMKFWNNGVINVRARECPEGFVAGKLMKNKI